MWVSRSVVARLFEPYDCFVGARLQQMHEPNPLIEKPEGVIAGTEADGLFVKRDRFLYRSGEELALAHIGVSGCPVAIELQPRFVFGYGLRESTLRAQQLGFDVVCQRMPGRCRQSLLSQHFCACKISRGRGGQTIEHAGREHDHQPALGIDGLRIERQRAFEQPDRLRTAVTRCRLIMCGASPEDIIQRVRMLGWAGSLGVDQLNVECDCDPARDFVLQGEQIANVAIEPLGPEMCVGLGVDQLGVDADVVAQPPNAALRGDSGCRARGRSALCRLACSCR